ncbi:MAG: alpha/beta fold hydrolase [Ramlibacter sp.]
MTMMIDSPAGQLYVDDGGHAGLPVLLVHSFAGSTAHWKSQLSHLRQRRRAIAMDLRGHGRSDPPADGDFSVPALARDIAAVADALELRRFVLVGHSLGGCAAAAYAGEHPDRLRGLVLAGTPGKSPVVTARQVMDGLRADYDKVMGDYGASLLAGAQPAVRDELETQMHRVPREQALALVGAVFDFDPLPSLARYAGSKLIIDTPHGDGPAALHAQMPDITRKVITGTSHWPQLDRPQEFNRLLDEYLAWMA